ncbi:MAG: SH3 domain-containing protein [Pseudomonadota bacterium]
MFYTKKQLAIFSILILSVAFSSILRADKLYVSKNLKVHTEASLESPVNHLLLGGEEVEVLRIDGDFTEVQNGGDHIGWVASEFLSNIKPASLEKTSTAGTTTPAAENTQTKTNKIKPIAKKSVVKKPITKKKQTRNKQSGSSKKTKKQERIKTQTAQQQASIVNAETKQQLQLKLDKIRDILDMDGTSQQQFAISNNYNLNLWLIAAAGVFGFILGIMWHDFRQRRRHGGYKV